MQVERQNKVVEAELRSKLRLGGRWYYPGEKVLLDASDAEVYAARGIIKATFAEVVKNPAIKTLRPDQVGIQTKGEDQPPIAESPPVVKPEAAAPPASDPAPSTSPVTSNVSQDTGMTKPEEPSSHGRNQSSRRHR